MVNRENILKVADAIETHSIKWLGFNMDIWANHGPDRSKYKCETVACIGGWTDAIRLSGVTSNNLPQRAGAASVIDTIEFLGLSIDQGNALLYPRHTICWHTIDPDGAIAVLRHLAETGIVDWSVAKAVELPDDCEAAE